MLPENCICINLRWIKFLAELELLYQNLDEPTTYSHTWHFKITPQVSYLIKIYIVIIHIFCILHDAAKN